MADWYMIGSTAVEARAGLEEGRVARDSMRDLLERSLRSLVK